jgi:CMP-N-acetylneuraminic acid synthetase
MASLAIIPARGGSKGVPGKNLRPLAGKPLIAWSILRAREAAAIDTVMVSTDDERIAAVAREYGAEVPFLRPGELATDQAPTEPVMAHALDWYAANGRAFDTIVLLQPTSPLRLPGTIDAALRQFRDEQADSLLGVVESHHFYWRRDPVEALYDYRNRPRRQDIATADRRYRETGAVYISTVEAFARSGNRLSGSIALFLMDELEGWEIDSEADFAVLEALFARIADAD